jgi:malonyl CoA-acyl carrier protein transacylase
VDRRVAGSSFRRCAGAGLVSLGELGALAAEGGKVSVEDGLQEVRAFDSGRVGVLMWSDRAG